MRPTVSFLACFFSLGCSAQSVAIEIHGTASVSDDQFCWAPVQSSARLLQPSQNDVTIVLTSTGIDESASARVVFQDGARPTRAAFAPLDSLTLKLPKSGDPVLFSVAGKWTPVHAASTRPGDVIIQATSNGLLVASAPVTIRVRKDAEALTNDERDRLLAAMRQLHDSGWFNRYAAVHDYAGNVAHSFSQARHVFLAWHRAFMLDFERRLQAVDPSVALPYWRFDAGAPKLFTAAFLGEVPVTSPSASVVFAAVNPLTSPATALSVDLGPMDRGDLLRGDTFSWRTQGPYPAFPSLPFTDYASATDGIEWGYHGSAHVGVGGHVGGPATAAVDPLFFFLHANVDRAWAVWQAKSPGALDPTTDTGIYPRGAFSDTCCHPRQPRTAFSDEALWPWNVGANKAVPSWAADPGPAEVRFAFPWVNAYGPNKEPVVREMVDYMDSLGDGGALGFCYDEIPF